MHALFADKNLAAEMHGKAYGEDMIRLYPGLVQMLSTLRSQREAVAIVDEIYDRIQSMVTENPKDYGLGCIGAYLHISKQM